MELFPAKPTHHTGPLTTWIWSLPNPPTTHTHTRPPPRTLIPTVVSTTHISGVVSEQAIQVGIPNDTKSDSDRYQDWLVPMCQVHIRDVARQIWPREYNKSGPLTTWFDWSKISTSVSGQHQHICAGLLRAHDKSGPLTTWFRSGESWSSTAQGIQGSYQPGFVRCPGVCLGHVGTHIRICDETLAIQSTRGTYDQGFVRCPRCDRACQHTQVYVYVRKQPHHKNHKNDSGDLPVKN